MNFVSDVQPRTDLNLSFIKECWEVAKGDIVNFVKEFLATIVLPKAITTSFLALISKNDNPQQLNKHRPIGLVGCLYKILAQVLAGRTKKVLHKVISAYQYGFYPHIRIFDSVVVVNEVANLAKCMKGECLLFKVNFEKVYDSVSWKYLEYFMHRMGFNEQWIKWMRASVSSNTMPVLVNGRGV